MVQDVVIEPVGDGPYISITADGAELGHMSSQAYIEFEAGALPVLTLKIPFMRCKYTGKCMLRFEESENDYPIFESISESNEGLREQNKHLQEMVDDLNRRISILLDT
jgi:hypothetical protein